MFAKASDDASQFQTTFFTLPISDVNFRDIFVRRSLSSFGDNLLNFWLQVDFDKVNAAHNQQKSIKICLEFDRIEE